LTLVIILGRFGSPSGLQLPKGGSLGSVKVHSLTFLCTPGSMKCDSRASYLALTFASPCLGCEPKAKVAIVMFIRLWVVV